MRRSCLILALTLALLLGSAAISVAWDTYYDGSELPTDQGWEFGGTDLSTCSSDGNTLRILDNLDQTSTYFRRTVAAFGQPVTTEARVRVVSASDLFSPFLKATNGEVGTLLAFRPDELRFAFGWAPNPWFSFPTDFSVFHTVRVAIDSQGRSLIWLDGILLAQGIAQSSQGDMSFGVGNGTSDSYWDYVAASPDFLPIPEPSSLLALAGGLMGLVGRLRRRANRKR